MNTFLKQRRIELGLTLEAVGKIVGVSKGTVQKWESGFIDNMKRDKIALLSSALKISPLKIIGYEDDTPKILMYYNVLNQTGKEEAEKRIEELTHIDKYTNNTCSSELLNAAHEISGATEDEKKHDNDIMDDENF